jgi:hypothetical protein
MMPAAIYPEVCKFGFSLSKSRDTGKLTTEFERPAIPAPVAKYRKGACQFDWMKSCARKNKGPNELGEQFSINMMHK